MDRSGSSAPASTENRVADFFASVPILSRFLIGFNIAVHIFIWIMSYDNSDFAINPYRVIYLGVSNLKSLISDCLRYRLPQQKI